MGLVVGGGDRQHIHIVASWQCSAEKEQGPETRNHGRCALERMGRDDHCGRVKFKFKSKEEASRVKKGGDG